MFVEHLPLRSHNPPCKPPELLVLRRCFSALNSDMRVFDICVFPRPIALFVEDSRVEGRYRTVHATLVLRDSLVR
jgi:hypothetical protein